MSEEKKPPNRTIVRILNDEIPSDHEKTYPVDIVKEAYRRWDGSVKSFCKRFGLSKNLVEQYIAAGQWDRLQAEYRTKFYNTLKKDRLDILELKQDIIQRIELYKLLDVERQLQDLEDHVSKFGDFFVRDGQDEIVRDGFGNPLSRKIGLSRNDLAFLKETEITRETNKSMLKLANDEREEEALEEGKDTIDAYLNEGSNE